VEFIGYCARAAAANSTNKLMPYVVQSAFILLPPALFAATIYMCLGRVITLLDGDRFSPIKASRLTKVFVSADILSFLVQGGSSGLFVLAFQNALFGQLGKGLVVGGLVMQLISFALFGLTAILFHSRLTKAPTSRSYHVDGSWIRTMHMLYGVSSLIIMRSIFRIVEYIMGTTGYPLTHEWMLYTFDTVPMLGVTAFFYFRYPDNLVRQQTMSLEILTQASRESDPTNKGWNGVEARYEYRA
jgi:hypothetical protein